MTRRHLHLLIGSASLLALVGAAIARDMYISSTTEVVVPYLKDVQLNAVRAHEKGFFATLVRPIYKTDPNAPQLYLTYFGVNEKPAVIGAVQPTDAIVFSCPEGTDIPVSRAFSHFDRHATNQYVWGPYSGDESARVRSGVDPVTVFTQSKFAGRADGFSFVDANNSLTVSGYTGEAIFFASAAPPSGFQYRIRCSIVQTCGDYFLDSPEECDDGAANSDSTVDACRTDCRSAYCGDGIVDTGETCDDGNTDDSDACSNTCTVPSSPPPPPPGPPSCGNGVIETGESCDDGNASNTDACLTDCTDNVCGDGYVAVGPEQCDDGATCMGVDGGGNLIGEGNWCDSDGDCAVGTTCGIYAGDGCDTLCAEEALYLCELREDANPGVPERSFCEFTSPGL